MAFVCVCVSACDQRRSTATASANIEADATSGRVKSTNKLIGDSADSAVSEKFKNVVVVVAFQLIGSLFVLLLLEQFGHQVSFFLS